MCEKSVVVAFKVPETHGEGEKKRGDEENMKMRTNKTSSVGIKRTASQVYMLFTKSLFTNMREYEKTSTQNTWGTRYVSSGRSSWKRHEDTLVDVKRKIQRGNLNEGKWKS
jgi:hypothetical protein